VRKADEDAPPPLSRIEQCKRDKIAPQMPLNPAPHITDWLIELGLVASTGMGSAVLTWTEISAWQARTSLPIEPWVSRLLRRLSAAYLAESRKAESETCPPPCRIKVTRRQREVEEAELRDLLG